MLTSLQTNLLTRQFTAIAPQADAFAADFYETLFILAPGVRSLFPAELTSQRQKLIAALATVIKAIDRLETVAPAISALGRRHANYGTEEAHFAVVGEAILATLERHLGEDFDSEARQAWSMAYAIVSDLMIDGMRSSERAAA